MTTEPPWSKPPFWAKTHNKDEQRRRQLRTVIELKRLFRATNPFSKLWEKRLAELQKAEREAGLTPTTYR